MTTFSFNRALIFEKCIGSDLGADFVGIQLVVGLAVWRFFVTFNARSIGAKIPGFFIFARPFRCITLMMLLVVVFFVSVIGCAFPAKEFGLTVGTFIIIRSVLYARLCISGVALQESLRIFLMNYATAILAGWFRVIRAFLCRTVNGGNRFPFESNEVSLRCRFGDFEVGIGERSISRSSGLLHRRFKRSVESCAGRV
jgi:hypothetical protein